jgi:hypothetical protein
VGVLLVHGIGDHQEGETLTSFGEPLVDWIRDWLRADGHDPRGDAGVPGARLRATRTEAESPAYAELSLRAPARGEAGTADEKWLLCEAWWGGSVRAPPSLKLLGWMWTRGPLLIYWHIFLGRGRPLGVAAFSVWAFLLAGLSQLLVAVAIALWVIPIGPWRRGVVATVRALTLTLGDSYVLLEHDIQRGALVQRVRKSLGWLEDRVEHLVVLAHSQGGAIAHEALRTRGVGKTRLFLSVGSGLEKLQFLRVVREQRLGLVPASLIFPSAALGIALFIAGAQSGERVVQAVGGGLLLVAFFLGVLLWVMLEDYRDNLSKRLADSALTGLLGEQWLDLHASHDVVPMGSRSVFTQAPFLVRGEVYNERSFIHDHTTYFDNRADFLARAWQAMSGLSQLRLFEPGDVGLLERHATVHRRYARLLAASHGVFLLATLALAWAIRDELAIWGHAVLDSVGGGLPTEFLKRLRSVASAVASVAQRVWPGQVPEKTVTDALFGVLVLFGAIMLAWLAFKGFWRLRCRARWRLACRRVDVLHSAAARNVHALGCVAFGLVGFAPLIIAAMLLWAPGAMTARSLAEASAIALASLAMLLAFGYVVAAPWLTRVMWGEGSQPLHERVLFPVFAFVFALIVEQFALWLRPSWDGWALFIALCAAGALAWHALVLTSRAWFGMPRALAALAMPVSAVVVARLLFGLSSTAVAAVWFASTLLAVGIAAAWVGRERLVREIRAASPRLARLVSR